MSISIPTKAGQAEVASPSANSGAAHAQTRTERRGSFRARFAQSAWGFVANHPRLHGLLMELRSLLWRIEFQSKLYRGSLVVDFGLARERAPSGQLVPNRRSHARIGGIENFVSNCPGATLFERWVFLQGWDAAEQFALRSCGTTDTVSKAP